MTKATSRPSSSRRTPGIGANLMLGLTVPFVTVSHGFAHDIAGTGIADPDGMLASIRLAADLVAGD